MASSSRSSSRLQSKAPVSYEETPDEFEDEPTKRIKMSSKKLQHDKKLYPIEIVKRDPKKKRIKVHYVGYPSSMDEWKDCTSESERVCLLRQRLLPSPETELERRDLFFDKMYRTIKYKLFSSKREDPEVQLEMEIDFDIFNNYISTLGTASERQRRTVYSISDNETLSAVLGDDWDYRILNKNLDFSFVSPGTFQFWLKPRGPIPEFKIIGGVPIETGIEREPIVVFSFVRDDGTKATYESGQWRTLQNQTSQ